MTIRKLFLRIVGISFGSILVIFLLIRLITGGKEVKVPDIRGKEVTIALETLGKVGLNLKLSERRFDEEIPKDHIIFQDPRPGIGVKKGREIKVIISKGSQKVFVPLVRGRSLRSGEIVLRQNSLKTGRIARTYSSVFEEDVVMAQSREPNLEVNREEGINLLVSLGSYPLYFYMPDLIGKSLERASKIMESLGLRIGHITYEVDPSLEEGMVINQVSSFGYPVKKGSMINLVISTKSRTPLQSLRTRFYPFRYLVPKGLRPKRIRIVVSDALGEREVYNALLSPGKEIDEVIAITGRAKARVYIDDKLEREMTLR